MRGDKVVLYKYLGQTKENGEARTPKKKRLVLREKEKEETARK